MSDLMCGNKKEMAFITAGQLSTEPWLTRYQLCHLGQPLNRMELVPRCENRSDGFIASAAWAPGPAVRATPNPRLSPPHLAAALCVAGGLCFSFFIKSLYF